MTHSLLADFPALQQRLAGPSFVAGTPGYDNELTVFNKVVTHRPAIVVGATCAADVSDAVIFAVEHDMDIAVLNTGHGPSLAAGPTTLMITTRRMTNVEIRLNSVTARVEAGVRFGQLVNAAAPFGLAPLAGSSPGVGVVGYHLSGGASPTMGRLYGWAADHVVAIEVVTADGRWRHVDKHSEADLFSAMLGGKGNFGVVTAMEIALFPVTRLYAGALFYSGEHVREVMNAYLLFTQSAPDQVSTGLAVLNLPPLPTIPPFMRGKSTVSLRVSYVGDAARGNRLIEPLRKAAPVLMDTVADMPFTDFASISADPTDPATAVEQFALLRDLSEGAVDAIVGIAGPEADSRVNIVDIRHLQGAFSRAPMFPNAVGARDAAFAFFALIVVPPGQRVVDYLDSGRELTEALAPWFHTMASPSFQGPDDTTESGTRRAYEPDTYQRLVAAKSK